MSSEPGERFEQGLTVRREVLGAEFVDAALANATAFNRPIQELTTEYCWGAVWTRPGLDRRSRSVMNLAMLTALNRSHELAVHVRGAVRSSSWTARRSCSASISIRRSRTATGAGAGKRMIRAGERSALTRRCP